MTAARVAVKALAIAGSLTVLVAAMVIGGIGVVVFGARPGEGIGDVE